MRLNMKTIAAATLATGLAMGAGSAMAANDYIERALKKRPNVSKFYEAAKKMGVLDELQDGKTYTVFAPTNAAFEKLTQDKYPCLYSGQCREEIADILRNHFVPESVTFTGPIKSVVFSMDKMNVNLGSEAGEVTSASGHRIVNRGQVIGGIICEINGVIASGQELANISQLKFLPVEVKNEVIEKTVTDKVFYAPDGTQDGVSRTTSFTSVPAVTTVEPVVVPRQ